MLGLGFPGGPVIDQRSTNGDPKRFAFPRAMLDPGTFDLSYSGLKTAVKRALEANGTPDERTIDDVCASFQAVAIEVLLRKLEAVARAHGAKSLSIAAASRATARCAPVSPRSARSWACRRSTRRPGCAPTTAR
jgi:N6-L-threonylcarbamoyladenine synthase